MVREVYIMGCEVFVLFCHHNAAVRNYEHKIDFFVFLQMILLLRTLAGVQDIRGDKALWPSYFPYHFRGHHITLCTGASTYLNAALMFARILSRHWFARRERRDSVSGS